jgi:hypothetical protein
VWDAGNGIGTVNQDIVGNNVDYTQTSITITSGISSAQTYYFKIRAKNIYGWGSYSSIASIVSSDVPSQMFIPTTTLSGSNVRITFLLPTTNGEAITRYQILIL